MSVPRNERSLSKYEYFNNGMIMCDMLFELASRKFGINKKKKAKLEDQSIIQDYPKWLIKYERRAIIKLIKKFMMHLRYADEIDRPEVEDLWQFRRYHIIEAKTVCHLLLDELDCVHKMCPMVTMESLMQYIDCVSYEIRLLKRLEHNDYKRYKKWKYKDTDKDLTNMTNETEKND